MQILKNRLERVFGTKIMTNLFVLISIITLFSFFNKGFLVYGNFMDIFRNSSFIGFAILAQTIVMIGGGIDVSIGGIAGISAIGAAYLMEPLSLPLAIIFGLLIGIFCGLFNGILITRLKISPLIVTLGSMQIYFGLMLVITKGVPLYTISEKWQNITRIKLFDIPFSVLLFIIVSLLLIFFLNNIKAGRNMYAVGGNEEAAIISGISVRKTEVFMYILSGLLSSIGGLLALSWIGSGQPTLGLDWLLRVIAASIIGGTSLDGGEGSIIGSITGILILGIIDNGLTMMNLSHNWRGAFTGAVVILAVLLDVYRKNKGR